MSRRDRRRGVLGFGVASVLLLGFSVLQARLRDFDFPNFVLHAIFNLNFVLLLTLLVMLGRNVFKLAQQRKQPGSPAALPLRLGLYSLALVLPVTILMFVGLSETLITIVEKWFEPSIDRMLADALAVPVASLEHVRAQARTAADALLETADPWPTSEQFARRARELGLWGAELRAEGCEPLVFGSVPPELEPATASGAWTPLADGSSVLALARMRGGMTARAAIRFPLPLDELARMIARQVAEYNQAKRVHVPVRKSYVMALGLLVLAALFSTTWAAFQVSRGISAPLGRLAQAARDIARSPDSLEALPAIELAASAPAELHVLVQSFERMRQTLSERTHELEQASRLAAWREVARRVAHEVKNPLTPIQLSAQRLRRRSGELPAPLRELVEECTQTIGEEVDRMRRLVEDFSRFAQLPRPRMRPADLNQLARSVAAPFEGALVLELFEPMPMLELDPDLFRQVLLNLVHNALEATEGRGLVRLQTFHAPERNVAGFVVVDQGEGIAAPDLEKVFLPYYSTKGGGTGLGLAIVHQIVEQHQGRASVVSEPGRGTSFTVELPLEPREENS